MKEVPVKQIVTQEVIKEVPVEKLVEVEKEVIKTVEIEKPVQVIKEVVKEVLVPGDTVVVEKEVIKTVEVEIPVEIIVEKEVISSFFCCGGYSFKSALKFVKFSKQLLKKSSAVYISHVIFAMLMENEMFIHNKAKNWKKIIIFMGKTANDEILHASKNWDIKYKKKMSVTSNDSFIIEINKLKKK